MKVFVTGATGCVGGPIARHLHSAGHQVVGLARSDDAAQKLKSQGIDVHRGDLNEPSTLLDPVAAADAVVHAGIDMSRRGSTSGGGERQAVETMLSALRPGAKFAYTSGFGIYMGSDGTSRSGFDESVRATPPPWLSYRVALEDDILAMQDRVGIVLRLPLVYGGPSNLTIDMMLDEGRTEGRVTYIDAGENLKSGVYVDDMAEAYRLAIEKLTTSTVLQIADGRTISARRLAEVVARKIGPNIKVESISLDEALQKIFWAGMLASDMVMIGDRAKALLGWNPSGPSIEDVLRPA